MHPASSPAGCAQPLKLLCSALSLPDPVGGDMRHVDTPRSSESAHCDSQEALILSLLKVCIFFFSSFDCRVFSPDGNHPLHAHALPAEPHPSLCLAVLQSCALMVGPSSGGEQGWCVGGGIGHVRAGAEERAEGAAPTSPSSSRVPGPRCQRT